MHHLYLLDNMGLRRYVVISGVALALSAVVLVTGSCSSSSTIEDKINQDSETASSTLAVPDESQNLDTQLQGTAAPTQPDDSEPLTLRELIIENYEKTGDADRVREFASKFEENGQYFNAGLLYEALGDTNSMKEIAEQIYIGDPLSVYGPGFLEYNLIGKFGLELTPEIYNRKGDHWIAKFNSPDEASNLDKKSILDEAFNAYELAGNKDGMSRVALGMEERGDLYVAFEIYKELGNKDGMSRVALGMEERGDPIGAFRNYINLKDEESAYRIAKKNIDHPQLC